VDYEKTEVEGDSNLIILTFKVTEGTAVVVKKIAFSGISAFLLRLSRAR